MHANLKIVHDIESRDCQNFGKHFKLSRNGDITENITARKCDRHCHCLRQTYCAI